MKKLFSLVLVLLAFLWLLPLITLLMSSVRPLSEIRGGFWHWKGATFTLENYIKAWRTGMADYFLNSVKISLLATLLPLSTGSLAAYAITKLRFPGAKAVYAFFLATMLLPIQLILIPLFPWLIQLKLNDSHLGLIFVHAAFGMGWTLFHLVNFFQDFPDDLLESARVDGAGELTCFLRIVLPLQVPALLSYAVLQFIWVWNDLLLALTLIQSREKYPITAGLVNLQSPHSPQWGVVAAGSVLSIVPPILLFLVLQKFYGRELFKGAIRA